MDKHGETWALENNIDLETYPAKWNDVTHPDAIIRYNRKGEPYNVLAGHWRNEEMASKADGLIALHDGDSTGTLDMIKRAEQHGLKIYKEVVDVVKHNKKVQERLHNEVVAWATKMRDDKDAVVMDTESCGGNKTDEIISIGIVRLHNGEVLFNSLLKPSDDVKFNWYATQVHGITKSKLVNAPTLADVWHGVKPLLHTKNVLAFNFASDKRMLEQTLRKQALDIPEINWYCIMKAYKNYTLSSAVTNLTAACKEMNVKAGTHDAVDDALAAARLVHRIAQQYKRK